MLDKINNFRIWNKKTNNWLCIYENARYYIHPVNKNIFDIKWGKFLDAELHQFTGFLDKNKIPIYEKDLVLLWWDTTPKKGVFHKGCFMIESVLLAYYYNQCEVVNNIFN